MLRAGPAPGRTPLGWPGSFWSALSGRPFQALCQHAGKKSWQPSYSRIYWTIPASTPKMSELLSARPRRNAGEQQGPHCSPCGCFSRGVSRPCISNQPSTAKGQAATENILTAHPNIKGIFASNDNMAMGAIEALRSAKKLKNVMVVGMFTEVMM